MNVVNPSSKQFAAMCARALRLIALAGAGICAALVSPLRADTISLRPGMYETRVTSNSDGKTQVDRSCVTAEEAKDVVEFVRGQGAAGAPCKLTRADVQGRHLSGQAICSGMDARSPDIRADSEIDFAQTSFSGTVHNTAENVEGAPLDEVLKVSAKRVGSCS